MADRMIVVLVHGWSVYDTSTYGQLAERLQSERPDAIDVRQIWLSKYVSFRDEVRLEDVSRGFEAALRDSLSAEIAAGRKIACIAHSTGGPVLRDWWDRFYVQTETPCPVSHMIMLAPANFGSALAQLGKSRLSQLRSAVKRVEPGQRVLDWLELGSPESWDLNARWICDYDDPTTADRPLFPFVLTGQWIDRKFYDHVNSYTGELGSDGTVRVAAANLNASYLRLEQKLPVAMTTGGIAGVPDDISATLSPSSYQTAPKTAFAIVSKRTHTGTEDGILYSIRDDGKRHPTVSAILQCLQVETKEDYDKLCERFEQGNARTRERERLEKYRRPVLRDMFYIRDAMSMVIVRIRDERGYAIDDFDLKFTGPRNNPDLLPTGFFQDRQQNQRSPSTITYFVNHDKIAGTPAVLYPGGNYILRDAFPPLGRMGIQVIPRPREGYVHFLHAMLPATKKALAQLVRPDQTTLIDIVLRRCVREGVYRLTQQLPPEDFRDQPFGPLITL